MQSESPFTIPHLFNPWFLPLLPESSIVFLYSLTPKSPFSNYNQSQKTFLSVKHSAVTFCALSLTSLPVCLSVCVFVSAELMLVYQNSTVSFCMYSAMFCLWAHTCVCIVSIFYELWEAINTCHRRWMLLCAKVDVIAANTQCALVWPQLVAHLIFLWLFLRDMVSDGYEWSKSSRNGRLKIKNLICCKYGWCHFQELSCDSGLCYAWCSSPLSPFGHAPRCLWAWRVGSSLTENFYRS